MFSPLGFNSNRLPIGVMVGFHQIIGLRFQQIVFCYFSKLPKCPKSIKTIVCRTLKLKTISQFICRHDKNAYAQEVRFSLQGAI